MSTRTRPATGSIVRVLSVAALVLAMATLLVVSLTNLRGPGRADSHDDRSAGAVPVAAREPGSFADCLAAAGVPATVNPGGGLQMTTPGGLSMSRDADGTMGRLSIDGTDYAEAYNSCLARFPDAGVDPDTARELDEQLRQELDDLLDDPWPYGDTTAADEAAGTWVACARQHGFDSAPEPTNGVVTVPGDLTVEAARQAAEACPLADYGQFGFGVSSEQGFPAEGVLEALTGGDLRLETNRDRQDGAALSA